MMRIVDSIMPMSNVEALAANGQKLRVSVTKTSAQGKSAQSSTPNLMCFSTDENSVWFNGKKYGMHMFKTGLIKLSTSSSHSDIVSALNGATFSDIKDFVNRGVICAMVMNKNSDFELCPVSISYTDTSSEKSACFIISTESKTLTDIKINMASSSAYKVVSSSGYAILHSKDVINNLTSSSTAPLSAAMGKKLQDEKLAKSDVVNNLTTTDTSKALSAAQGKALNDKISGLGNVYRIKGTKASIDEVYSISNSAKLGDVWNITSAFTIGGKPYPANTNVVCIAEWSTSTTSQNNWDPLGGTVDLSTYVLKSNIVDNITTSDASKPLSANQGRILGARLSKLEVKTGLYKLLKPFTKSSLGTKEEVDSLLGVYSTFSSAVTTGNLIYGIYNDSNSLTHTVAFTAYNSTSKKQIIMYAVINPTTMVKISANYEGTDWVSATIEQGALGEGTIIE